MAASTAPEAKRRVLVLLRARAALAGVDIGWSAPTEAEDLPRGGEMVYLGDVTQTGEWRVLGAGRRDEEYTVGLTVWVQQDGDDMQATEERSWLILDEVSGAIYTDPTLSNLLLQSMEILSASQRVGVASADATGSRIDAVLRCNARFIP
mgnify:CR=1 FL=1